MEDQGDMISVITPLAKEKKKKKPKNNNEICVGMSKNFQFSHLRKGNFIELFILPFFFFIVISQCAGAKIAAINPAIHSQTHNGRLFLQKGSMASQQPFNRTTPA